MALLVNGDPSPFREGMTVTDLLEEKKFSWPLITVYVGEVRIPKDQRSTTTLRDGDQVRVIHLMAGG
jgi:sulfur carrier protein